MKNCQEKIEDPAHKYHKILIMKKKNFVTIHMLDGNEIIVDDYVSFKAMFLQPHNTVKSKNFFVTSS